MSDAPASADGEKGRLGTDRWIALGLLVFALLYALQARTFRAGAFADPVGPRAFPLVLAGVMVLASLALVLRPTRERPVWPSRPVWLSAGLVCGSLIAYGYLLEPLGYLLSTTGVVVVLSLLFGGRPVKSTIAALALVLGLYLAFSSLLGLYLPATPTL